MEKNMTLEQIEELVNAYFDCRLSRNEEAELCRLLASSPLHSPDIDSCRLEMGIEAAMRKPRRSHARIPFRHILSIAASIALVIGICATIMFRSTEEMSSSTIVYIAGKKIENYTYAQKLAEQSQAESMAEMREMLNEAEAESLAEMREMQIEAKSESMEQMREMLNEAKAEKRGYDSIMNEMFNNK
ncbi:MAG: hypothetical protein J6A20_07095 [Muribaculaceae bacterium]|nr:hypothetical protein [Muribaculaceae bacterium]